MSNGDERRDLFRYLTADLADKYHGDFDWPGIAIAGRVFAAGAVPWRFSARDYLDAADRADVPLPLSGAAQATPWDPALHASMQHRAVAVHEEAVIDVLLADLGCL